MVRDYLTFEGADEDFHAFLTEFQQETDRAAAALAGAYLDSLLEQLLLARFVDQTGYARRTVEFGPLGSFAARIAVCYAFGLITKSERADLDMVRDVRNRFAHELHGLNFDDDEIATWCR